MLPVCMAKIENSLRDMNLLWFRCPMGQMPPRTRKVWTSATSQNERRQRTLVEIKTVEHVVRSLIALGEGGQAKPLFHECQERRKLVIGVADVAAPRIRRNDQQGNARS